jgi:membrane-associated protein
MDPGFLDFFINIDQSMAFIVSEYGFWTYLILFVIVTLETGLVVTSFLPGDSLLFVAGLTAASGLLNIFWLIGLFFLAGIAGNTLNYWVGHHFGVKVLREKFPDLVKKTYLERTERYFEKFGGKTIFIARFIPLVRTFAPFLAGVSSMNYRKFLTFSILSAALWGTIMPIIGYLFGTNAFIRENIVWFIYGIAILTLVTVVIIIVALIHGFFRSRREYPDDQQV